MKRVILFLLGFIMLLTLSACTQKQTLSGKYVSRDNGELYLLFEGNSLTIYENGIEIDNGEYSFNNNAIVFTFSVYAGNYTLNESRENLCFGSADDDNFGEIAFTKEEGE